MSEDDPAFTERMSPLRGAGASVMAKLRWLVCEACRMLVRRSKRW